MADEQVTKDIKPTPLAPLLPPEHTLDTLV